MLNSEIISYFKHLEKKGINLGLERVKDVLVNLDNPQDKIPSFHIAGTDGKGSVAYYLANIIKADGYLCGLYISPHLEDIRERIQINGEKISEEKFTQLVYFLKEYTDDILTYFEFLTVLAFYHFYESKVSFMVIETGLGGRLDATNTINKPQGIIITDIDYDHKEFLGETLEEIAREKAGIIKPKSVVISASQNQQVEKVIQEISFKQNASLFFVGKQIKFTNQRFFEEKQIFDYEGINYSFRNLAIKMKGKHQVSNATIAIGLIDALGLNISEEAIRKGLLNTFVPARFEIIKNEGKKIVLDGAHNPLAIRKLKDNLVQQQYNKLILILGILKDKDISTIVQEIVPLCDYLIITKPSCQRASEPKIILDEAKKVLSLNSIEIIENVESALKRALSLATDKDLICITGSFYTVAEARQGRRLIFSH